MSKMGTFWLNCVLVLFFGSLGTHSGGDPFPNQPRFVVEDGHLTIQSGMNRSVSILSSGSGGVFVNRVNMGSLSSSRQSGGFDTVTMALINRRLASSLNVVGELSAQVNQLEENVTDIAQRMNQFVGADQNRITNRGLRRYFAKVKMLEEKVNRLTTLLSENECSSNPCRNGGTCVDSYNGYVCNCPTNWEGPTCESDVNECGRYAGTGFGCQNGATCTNLPGSYRCDCPTNWFGIHCTEQHDDCTAASHQELCGHGTCVNEKRVQPGQPKYRCICEPGWTKSSTSPACIEDVNECSGNQQRCSVSPRVTCYNLPGTFFCGPCPAGYTGNGERCDDLNECESNNGGCSVNPFVECFNTPGSRRCGPCPNGYFGNGEQCMFQSVCSNNRGGCHPLATCIDNPAITMTYRECRCPPGYVGNGEGLTGCVPTQGVTCANSPCQYGTCQMVGNSYHCVCEAGYYGTNCEVAENPCSRNPCENGGTCINAAGSFSCSCPSGFSGPTCALQDQACGGYLSSNNGTLHYPEYSYHYDHGESCAWVITVEEGKVLNITFDHFHLEPGFNCEYDFLQLNDGPHAGSRVIGRFCSDQLHGETFQSTHNQVYLWFKSDRSISATGFTLSWKAVDPVCGGILNASEYGSVRSPGYPGVYPVNRTCSWLVQVPYGKRIQFNFATLMLESHENCSYDYVKIFDGANDGDPVIGTYCTTETPPPLITSGHAATLLFHSDHSIQDSGFNIAYSSVPGIDGCGGTLTSPQGVLTSPNFPSNYANPQQCEWLIRIRPNNRIKISFKEFQIDWRANCLRDSITQDSLEIYDGSSDASELLGRFCGNTLPPDIVSNTHQLYVRFKVGMSVGAGFQLEYKTVCGGIYTELSGAFTSPFYPEPYPSHTDCLYEIILPEGNLVNLTVHNTEIEAHPYCRFDVLHIRDGDSETSPLLAKMCGHLPLQHFVSTYNKLWIQFQTDGTIENRGFSAEYESINMGCGGIKTANNGQISSPRDRQYYPHNVSCTWLIKAPEKHIIRLTFTSFKLERSASCAYDYVLAEDTDGIVIGEKFCGTTPPPVITSMDNILIVKFATDESVSFEGFTAEYQFLDASEACGGDFYQSSGTIKSPGFPQHYPHNAKCVWVLHAPNSRQITLTVTNFTMENHADCKFDYLEIRNGGYKTSPLINKFCGTQIMPTIQSHSNLLRLEFQSDGSMSAPGFQIDFDSSVVGCGGMVTSSRGSIVSPNYPQPYPQSADCEWLIRVSEGSTISLSIIEIDIEEHTICQYDYLQIFDGSTENSKSLVKLCNNQQNPGPIVTKGNTALIRFRSDFGEEAGGFQLVYQAMCKSMLTKRRGVIESPNFPNPYPHNHNCTWTIKAPMGSNISVSFSHIFIEGDGNCTMDYVEVKEIEVNGNITSRGKFCGDMSRPPPTILISSHLANIELITDRSVSREGFRLEYSVIGCGAEFFDRSFGYISSPNYPASYPRATECFWHIKYPPGNSVQLTIIDIDLENHQDCMFDFIRVYAGEDEHSPKILDACLPSSNATVLTSHGNQMYVHFRSDISVTHRGFTAQFKKIEKGCGGLFTASDSVIMSPNFPESAYSVTDECEWLIQLTSSNLVMIEFYDFEMPDSLNCIHGYVAIYDGRNSSAPLLLRHCGSSKPEGFISSTGNEMLVRLVTDGVNVGKGFRAHYKEGCGRRLLADEGGEITSFKYPNRMRSMNCTWIIYASQIGEKVSLTTTHLDIRNYANCTYSSLTIYDGDMADSPVINQICGTHLPPPVISRGSIMHVFLKNSGVFRAVYGLLSEHCGGDFTAPSGSFASPGYPTNYDMQMECVWTFSASPGSKIQISFQSFHIESSDYCNTDYVEIHENDATGRLIGKYCGDTIPSNVTALHKVWIKFRSDDIGTAPGFMAHFELQHESTIIGSSGYIASPGYPQTFNREGIYEWTVIAPDGMFMSVLFYRIEIPLITTSSACYSKVKIIDGFDEESPVLGEFCGYEVPEPIFSTGNVIKIVFEANHFPSLFHLHWSAVNESGVRTSEDSCLEEYILNATSTAVVQSPNYPNNYPNEYNCTYVIRTKPTHHVDLRFDSLYMEGRLPTCAFDKLESYVAPNPDVDDWTLNSTLCGYMPDVHLTSPNNVLKLKMSTDKYIVQRGFRGTARSACGGQLFGYSGVLRSSSVFPNLQSMNGSETFQCEWIIQVKDRRTIQLTFENFDIESDSTCSTNYILLRNGGSVTSPLLGTGKYCGSSLPTVPETSSNQVYVQLMYRPTSGRSPIFDIRYSVVTMGCGGHIYLSPDIPYAEITSPNYPSPPATDASCDWIIVSPAGTRMRVDFESQFHLGQNCYYGDDIDYLEVNDGGTENADLIRRYCGNDQPSSALSTGNALFMKYVSNSDNKEAGFKATVKIAHCGGTIISWQSFIKSPDFPNDYGSSIECEWFLKMPNGFHISLSIKEFHTPTANNCSLTDYLEIRDKDAEGEVLATICGNPNDLPKLINIPGSEAYVKFKSNSAVTAKGFLMFMQANIDDEGCGGYLEGPTGVITSPRYPNALSHARECYWRIQAPVGRRVKVMFEELNLPLDEDLNSCSSFVNVYNISWRYYPTSTDGQRYCGIVPPQAFDSLSGSMYLRFYTPGLTAGQGFRLTYSTEEEAVCGGSLSTPSGIFASPNFTLQSNSYYDCRWRALTEENQTLVMKFVYLDLPGDRATFCKGSVLLFLTERGTQDMLCGNITDAFIITSPRRLTDMRLITHSDIPYRGFYATYNISNCGGVLDGSNVEITSPGYPNNYPPGIDCHWILEAPYGEVMKITFVDLRLEDDCSKDYIMIGYGRSMHTPSLGKFCGSHSVAPIVTTTGMVTIQFHSDDFGSAPGFKITTQEVQRGCGGLLRTRFGNITFPRYENNFECVYTVDYAPGHVVKIEFDGRFDIEMDSSCSKDYLKFEEPDSNGQWVESGKMCGSVTPQPFLSKSNKLRITFHTNDRITGDGFDLRYQADCGGNFTNPTGFIISPNYPGLYTNFLNCSYTIGKEGDYVTLSFDDNFNIEDHDTCVFDYIDIYQSNISESSKQGGYCGNVPPATRTLLGPVTVRFVTDSHYASHGFKLNYEILNCGAVLTASDGVIATPNHTADYLNQLDCTWHIVAPANKVIQLRFLNFNVRTFYGCYDSYLAVYDGRETGRLIGKFCGEAPKTIKSIGNELTLRFFSERKRIFNGFAAYYHNTYGPTDGCGGNLNATTGEINSLDANSDGSYEPDLDCAWLINVLEPDKVIKLTFNSFDLEMPTNGTCESDFLELREYNPNGPVVGRFCGNHLPASIVTNVDSLFVHFHSDEKGHNTGFWISYTVEPSLCGKSQLSSNAVAQTLTSPNYPNAYPLSLRCKWLITSNRTRNRYNAYSVQLSFNKIDIPCGGDFLMIRRMTEYDPPSDTTRTCGNTTIQVAKIRGNALVTFNSDALNDGGHGFSLNYQDESCNNTYNADSGTIASEGARRLENMCRSIIAVSAGKKIALYVNRFDYRLSTYGDCSRSYVKIYDGTIESSSLLATYCGAVVPLPVFSTTNSMYVDFYSSSDYSVYSMTYMSSEKGSGCGGSISDKSGVFSSPLYPQPYNKTDECVWNLSVSGYHTIILIFREFALNSSRSCDTNYVEIYEGTTTDISNRIGRYCGPDRPARHELRRNAAVVKYVTDATNDQPGFVIQFFTSHYVPDVDPAYIMQNFAGQESGPDRGSLIV